MHFFQFSHCRFLSFSRKFGFVGYYIMTVDTTIDHHHPCSMNSRLLLSLTVCSVCGPRERERWIGLASHIHCSCTTSPNFCGGCRGWYRWSDGSQQNFSLSLFADGQPHVGQCFRMMENGQWSSSNCSTHFKSVCKKGDCFSINIINYL